MTQDTAIFAALSVLAVAIHALGRYGWRNARRLAPAEDDHRVAVVRRGAVACMIVGIIFLVGALVGALAGVVGAL